MERELWRAIVAAIRRLPRRSPRGGVYDNGEVLAVLFWAALWDRSILWASQRRNWPMQAWRRRLPHQSTLSRRLRDPDLLEDLSLMLRFIQRAIGGASDGIAILDGKPLMISEYTHDSDAKTGRGAGRYAKGYKFHALIDMLGRLLAWRVEPMNVAECVVAADLVSEAARVGTLPANVTILGDSSYDSNPLHQAVTQAQAHLIAPRRRPDRPLCKNRRHHPGRLESVARTEHDPTSSRIAFTQRSTIERYFGTLASYGAGLYDLPSWVRRLHRVRPWVAAKLVINAARITRRHQLAA